MKHHYIPVFYSKKWTLSDGRLCEFSRPYGKIIRPRRVHPAGTGYIDNLYSIPNLPDAHKNDIEEFFFKPADSRAAVALDKMLIDPEPQFSVAERSGWTRFMTSLLLRSPEDLADFLRLVESDWLNTDETAEAEFQKIRKPNDPETFTKYLRLKTTKSDLMGIGLRIATRLIDHEGVGSFINNMEWTILDFAEARHELLTSDRPLVMTNGISNRDSYIIIPIDPRKAFLATNGTDFRDQLMRVDINDISDSLNFTVCSQAVRYVWSTSDAPLRFLGKVMSINKAPSLVVSVANAVLREAQQR